MSDSRARAEKASPPTSPLDQNGGPRPSVSVIVPVVERPGPLAALYEEYSAPFREERVAFEFIFVVEPWAGQLSATLDGLIRRGEPIRVLETARTLGEAGQLKLAAANCRAEVVLTIPAYHRVEPECLPRLVRQVGETAQLVVARRWPRGDAWFNRLQNKIFHALMGVVSRQSFHDVACGVRAMRRDLLQEIPLYGEFSRFLPLLAVQEGFDVEELPCRQHPADKKTRVYPLGTYLRRAIDLFGAFFLLRFNDKPLRFFGFVGSGFSIVGGTLLLVLLIQRLMGQAIANRPLLLLAVLLFTLGVQVLALGLIAELIVHLQAPGRRSYRVRERA